MRISAQEALNDPWIQRNAPSVPLNPQLLRNIVGFYVKKYFFKLTDNFLNFSIFNKKKKNIKARSKFKQAVLAFIATQIVSSQDKEELMNTFKSLDRDGDGKLTKEELVEGFFFKILTICNNLIIIY